MEPKNSYRWVPMISGYGTEKLFSMGFEILGLAFIEFLAFLMRCLFKNPRV